VTVKNDDVNTVWVTLGGYNSTTVFQSVNGGTTWTNISTGLPQIPAYAIVQNNQSTTEVQLYVGTELGVYFKKGTDNWIAFNTGLPNVKIGEIEIYYAASPQNSILRAATFGRGLWETPVYYVCTPLPVPTITGPAAVCAGATGVIYTTESGMTGYTWSVSSGGNITGGSGTNQIMVTWTTTGSKTVSVNYVNSNGCTAPSPTVYPVIVNPAPLADFSFPANICDGQNVQFTDISQPNGGGGISSWLWNFGDPASGTNNSSTLQNPAHQFTAAGSYVVNEIITNAGGCADTMVHTITVNPLPQAIITPNGPTTFCEGLSVTLTASAATSYLWSTGATTQSIVVTISGNYTVTVTNGFGCTATSSPTGVTVLPLAGIPDKPSGPDTVDLHFITTSDYITTGAPAASSYSWDLNPSNAGIISGTTTTGTVVWNTSFLGSVLIKVKSVNSCGESLWSDEKNTIVENSALGIQDKTPIALLIYPNPATNRITVDYPGYSKTVSTSLDLYEIRGQLIKRVDITERITQVDISTLPAAVYMIRLTIGNDTRMIKLVKTVK
jgi:PKD repeat protein